MQNAEIILNLWYVYDDTGHIYSLRARCYVGSGNDDEKLALLSRFAPIDYLIAQPFPVPERLHTTFIEDKSTKKLPVIEMKSLELLGGPQVLFEEIYVALENQLPAQTKLEIGQQPLVCITPLFGDDEAEIGPRFSGRITIGAEESR